MRFLLDQDVYAITARFLSSLGHEVVTAAQLGAAQASDTDLLRMAREQDRIFVTRMLPINQRAVHLELERVLNTYSEDQLKKAFTVIEAGRHRFRRLRQ